MLCHRRAHIPCTQRPQAVYCFLLMAVQSLRCLTVQVAEIISASADEVGAWTCIADPLLIGTRGARAISCLLAHLQTADI